jgi:hypothetical protein
VSNTASELVTRLVDEVMNRGDLDRLGELRSPQLAPKLRTAFAQFQCTVADWRRETHMRQLADRDATLGELGSLG